MVLTPEYEDPDRDTGEQADACYQPPTPLDGAEDVLSAQDWSSAFRIRRSELAGPQIGDPETPLDAANLASLPN